MTSKLAIKAIEHPVEGMIIVPGSKSITNRALVLAAMAGGTSTLSGALFSDDTHYMAEALRHLGIEVKGDKSTAEFIVQGRGGSIPAKSADLFIGNSGTTARFLTAFLSLGHGEYRLDGVARMRERPIKDLLDALNQLDVDAKSEADNGCPPLLVKANGLKGGEATLRADISSQYLTALLQVAPLSSDGIILRIDGELSSQPYIELTLRVMEQWGVTVENRDYREFVIPGGQKYVAQDYQIEPDASSASYFFAVAAVTNGRILVPGLGRNALQGDVGFVDVLEQMGCQVERGADYIVVRGAEKLQGVDVDMNGISDTVMTLAAIAPFAEGPTTIRNIGHIRHKETDRISALATELGRLGVCVEERPDSLTIYPTTKLKHAEILTYDDHRMAMSFAVTGLRWPGVVITNPDCVSKTFPDFFQKLQALCFWPGV
jgi:3-phosphoshikimate 1-carboxyvinyltransferase